MNDMWTSLREFVNWYCMTRPLGSAPENPVRLCQDTFEMVLFREGQYQAEMICLLENRVVQPHRHPDVASMDIHLSGTGRAIIAGHVMPPGLIGMDPLSTGRRIIIPRNVLHWGHSDTHVVVISLQRWYGVEPGFLTENWEDEK